MYKSHHSKNRKIINGKQIAKDEPDEGFLWSDMNDSSDMLEEFDVLKKALISIEEERNDNTNSIRMVDELTRTKKLRDKSGVHSEDGFSFLSLPVPYLFASYYMIYFH